MKQQQIQDAAEYWQQQREQEYKPISDHINYRNYPTKEEAWQWYEQLYGSLDSYETRFDNMQNQTK